MRHPTHLRVVLILASLGALSACQRSERAASTSTEATLPKSAPLTSAVLSTHSYTKPPMAELEKRLSPMEYDVTQREATEPPFHNQFWDNHEPGLYVDIVT